MMTEKVEPNTVYILDGLRWLALYVESAVDWPNS
jgi:hypothetical protein